MAEEKREMTPETAEVTEKVQNAQEKYVDQRVDTISKEAVEVVKGITELVTELGEKKSKEELLNKIADIIGKLEVLTARDPNLRIVPVDVRQEIIDYQGTPDDVEVVKSEVVALIKNGEVQLARDLMLNLASELDIYITALPIGTYPIVLRAIVPLIEAEKYDAAQQLLEEALETLVVEKVVLPLPILRAEQAIIRASELTKDKEDANREELKKLLQFAKEQLELAQALGYGRIEEDYKELFEEIEKIEKKLAEEESTKDIFETLKAKLIGFMGGFNKPKEATQMPTAEEKKGGEKGSKEGESK
ncbi:MAG: YfdX family protein [Campylobacterales bacterium]